MDYSEMRQLLGDRIRFLRKEKAITQEQLAELVDKTTEHISYLERGERSPSFELLVDLAHALNVSLSYLLDITPPEESFKIAIPAPVPTNQLPDTVVEPIKPQAQRKTDLERMKEAFEKVQELQLLANEYGISDIFQDNGGKVLQVMIMLGLKYRLDEKGMMR